MINRFWVLPNYFHFSTICCCCLPHVVARCHSVERSWSWGDLSQPQACSPLTSQPTAYVSPPKVSLVPPPLVPTSICSTFHSFTPPYPSLAAQGHNSRWSGWWSLSPNQVNTEQSQTFLRSHYVSSNFHHCGPCLIGKWALHPSCEHLTNLTSSPISSARPLFSVGVTVQTEQKSREGAGTATGAHS